MTIKAQGCLVFQYFPLLDNESPFSSMLVFFGFTFIIFTQRTFDIRNIIKYLLCVPLTWTLLKLIIMSYCKCNID